MQFLREPRRERVTARLRQRLSDRVPYLRGPRRRDERSRADCRAANEARQKTGKGDRAESVLSRCGRSGPSARAVDPSLHLQRRTSDAAPARGAGARSAPARRRARRLRHPAREALGLRYGGLPADQGRRNRHHARQPRSDAGARRSFAPDDDHRSGDFPGVSDRDNDRPDRGSRAAGALLLHPRPPELGVVDGLGRVSAGCAGAGYSRMARRRRSRVR